MDVQSNKELIRKVLEEIAQGSVATLLESISDEVVWEMPNPDDKLALRAVYEGRDGTMQLLEDLGEFGIDASDRDLHGVSPYRREMPSPPERSTARSTFCITLHHNMMHDS